MKGNRAINTELNKVLGIELIAINQYFLHARILKNWGYHSLGGHVYKSSIETMKEADKLIERILFLEGLPNLQDLGKLSIGQTVPEVIKADLTLETQLRSRLVESITACEKDGDYVSRDLLAHILEECEERIDYLETQEGLLQEMGLQNYLQSAAGEGPGED